MLRRQTIFHEIPGDFFVQESASAPVLDSARGLGLLTRYYDGWHEAYTEALAGNLVGAQRTRIQQNMARLQSRRSLALGRMREGDQAVVQETLDQIRMDRQMAVDMPVTQIRWATPWIREVWVEEHGEIPLDWGRVHIFPDLLSPCEADGLSENLVLLLLSFRMLYHWTWCLF
jgi:hypothetical protein